MSAGTNISALPALGICLEEYEYPYPVQWFSVTSDLQSLRMAYGLARRGRSDVAEASS
jgi:hypothetical protein